MNALRLKQHYLIHSNLLNNLEIKKETNTPKDIDIKSNTPVGSE